MDIYLKKIRFKDFMSLHEIELPLKQLTVIVGSNASGKSNILNGMSLLSKIMKSGELPPSVVMQSSVWAGGADKIRFELDLILDEVIATYDLQITVEDQPRVQLETLIIGDNKIIEVVNGKGVVRDERDAIETPYNPQSPKIALRSVGDYGYKPKAGAIHQFIREWKFYDFLPDRIRTSRDLVHFIRLDGNVQDTPTVLNSMGTTLTAILADWHENQRTRFDNVNDLLNKNMGLSLKMKSATGRLDTDFEFFLNEGYKTLIPLKNASDGTSRLIAYYVLLNQERLPPLIAIEEPERNLHPAALGSLTYILEELARKTQVIVTTHSSQLLDAFEPDSISDDLEILLLSNELGKGTQVVSIEQAQEDEEALHGWIDDFGFGSAIFESELLTELVEV